MAEHQRDEWRSLTGRQRAERAKVLRGSWRGLGDLLNATRSVLAAKHAQERADLRDRQKRQRAAELAQARFPMFRDWLQQRSPADTEQRWHHHGRSSPSIEGPAFVEPAPQDIRAFMAKVDRGKVHYHQGSDRHAAFTDSGKVIDIHRATDRASVLAALQLSAQKWRTFTVHGDESFRRVCVELAREHGFKIANPELQRALGLERLLAPGRGLSL
jgi:hypothetical protein